MHKKTTPILILAILALVISACGIVAAQAGSPESNAPSPPAQAPGAAPHTLSVTGSGRVSLTPDIAYVTIGLRTQEPDAKAAVDLNSEQTQQLIDSLLDFGVAEADIQTINFNIYSFEDYNEPFSEKPPLVYSVENSVYVTVRDLESIGDLLSEAVGAGANNIWGIQFDVTDKSEALRQAREAAVAAARAQAEELADLAGVELGEIVNIRSFGGFPAPRGVGLGSGGAEGLDAAASVPVSPGLIQVTVDVNIVFEIR